MQVRLPYYIDQAWSRTFTPQSHAAMAQKGFLHSRRIRRKDEETPGMTQTITKHPFF
jgi:hypothetical protein